MTDRLLLDKDVEDALQEAAFQVELSREEVIAFILRSWLEDNRYLDPQSDGDQVPSTVANANEMEDDEEWNSPEALAKWRTRHIRDLNERAIAFHKLWRELEEERREGY
ncbi:hypothetical protein [Ensifer sp. SSB1]|uniref:hypothetical protein n=1 Tax=Ensifer sp. SSB1 TaxID=2795385 RepID=UPI001A4391C2|nr:hypothetical protein [Ensifer sp. SSB1]MBK5567416.1 hypothetical protein [Ensifer sp. SSB1]